MGLTLIHVRSILPPTQELFVLSLSKIIYLDLCIPAPRSSTLGRWAAYLRKGTYSTSHLAAWLLHGPKAGHRIKWGRASIPPEAPVSSSGCAAKYEHCSMKQVVSSLSSSRIILPSSLEISSNLSFGSLLLQRESSSRIQFCSSHSGRIRFPGSTQITAEVLMNELAFTVFT